MSAPAEISTGTAKEASVTTVTAVTDAICAGAIFNTDASAVSDSCGGSAAAAAAFCSDQSDAVEGEAYREATLAAIAVVADATVTYATFNADADAVTCIGTVTVLFDSVATSTAAVAPYTITHGQLRS